MLAGIGLLLPRWFDVTTPPQSFPSPIDASFTIGFVRFGGNEVIAAITVPVVCALLALFLRTRIGVAVRGTARTPTGPRCSASPCADSRRSCG